MWPRRFPWLLHHHLCCAARSSAMRPGGERIHGNNAPMPTSWPAHADGVRERSGVTMPASELPDRVPSLKQEVIRAYEPTLRAVGGVPGRLPGRYR